MITKLVRIGNSRGIRIPKALLDQLGWNGEVDLSVADGTLVVKPARKPQEGWKEAYEELARSGEDEILVDTPSTTRWDEEEWEW